MNIVKELRKSAGIQQKELAIAIQVSRPTVSDWESGKKDPSGERLKKLAEYFGVDELTVLGRGTAATQTEEDEEIWKIRDRFRNDPSYRLLFHAADSAKPEHLRAAAAMLKALEEESGNVE